MLVICREWYRGRVVVERVEGVVGYIVGLEFFFEDRSGEVLWWEVSFEVFSLFIVGILFCFLSFWYRFFSFGLSFSM